MSDLTHLDESGRVRMVDVGGKAVTERRAIASGRFETTAAVIELLHQDGLPKADALATARIAGIQGAKRTSELIPLCHPIPLNAVTVSFTFERAAVRIEATADTTGRTGVEMEALTAVAVAGLTLHDMVKAVDPAATLTDVRLEEKSGGRHGVWTRDSARESSSTPQPADQSGRSDARVVVVSTSAAVDPELDTTGPLILTWLAEHGFGSAERTIVADRDVRDGLLSALQHSPKLLITTGGTGITPDDRTPEATHALLDRTLPGVADAIRATGYPEIPTSLLSRGTAGVAGSTLVVNLAGSPDAVRDGLAVLEGVVDHALAQIAGRQTRHSHEHERT